MKRRDRLALSLFVLLTAGLAAASAAGPQQTVQPALEKRTLPAGPPMITQVKLSHLVGGGVAMIDVTGRNFGPEKDRRLTMDGVAVQNPLTWTDQRISFEMREPIDRTPKVHEFAVWNPAGQVVSNRYGAKFLATWDRANPLWAPAESEVTLLCWGVGVQQGGRIVQLGSATLPVLSWQHDDRGQNQIRVRIPKMDAGGYTLMIYDGGEKVSEPGSFMVR